MKINNYIFPLGFYLLFFINLFLLLVPSNTIYSGYSGQSLKIMSYYVNPVILSIIVGLYYFINNRNLGLRKEYLIATFFVFISLSISALINLRLSSIFMALLFVVASFSVIIFKNISRIYFLRIEIIYLLLYILTPLFIIFFNIDSWKDYIAIFDYSYHGFSTSRILFGLWSCIALFILSSANAGSFGKAAITILLLGIYFSQSRSAVISIGAALSYRAIYLNGGYIKILTRLLVIGLTVISAIFSWKIFGRESPLEVLSPERHDIVINASNKLAKSNIFFGAGGQVNLLVGGVETQAHNLLLQWSLNWGILGCFFILIYLIVFWRTLESLQGRMLFIVFLVFSFTQPIQGTPNFFAPLTLCILLTVAAVDRFGDRKLK